MSSSPDEREIPSEPTSGGFGRWLAAVAFLYIWLMVGFATGTLTLIGPTRWITAFFRASRWATYERHAMWVVMAAFLAGSFLLARWLYRRVAGTSRRSLRAGIPLTATVAAGVALLGWSDPAVLSGLAGGIEQQNVMVASGPEFVFGPYPGRTRLEELKAQGFTGVISLQHPAVVPFEPPNIAEEKATTAEIGLQFIHAPMVPWISDNAEALATIKNVVETGHGKYYVHCGLGRDRVTVVKEYIERLGATRLTDMDDRERTRTFDDRVAEGRFLMERGNLQILADRVWLVPWPNEKEGYGKLLGGHLQKIEILMDPSVPEEAAWIAEANKVFDAYQLPHEVIEYHAGDPAALEQLARALQKGPRPEVVIVPRTAPCRDAHEAEAFLQAWAKVTGTPRSAIRPGAGDPDAEGRPLPCEAP